MHTLKGLAGTLGLQALATTAAKAEETLAAPDTVEGKGEGKKRPVDDVLAAIAEARLALLPYTATPPAAPTPKPAPAPPQAAPAPAEAHAGIVALLRLLDTGDMQALDLHLQLDAAQWPGTPAQWQALNDALQSLDFAGAAALCREVCDLPAGT